VPSKVVSKQARSHLPHYPGSCHERHLLRVNAVCGHLKFTNWRCCWNTRKNVFALLLRKQTRKNAHWSAYTSCTTPRAPSQFYAMIGPVRASSYVVVHQRGALLCFHAAHTSPKSIFDSASLPSIRFGTKTIRAFSLAWCRLVNDDAVTVGFQSGRCSSHNRLRQHFTVSPSLPDQSWL
jgi:hypothetical protein